MPVSGEGGAPGRFAARPSRQETHVAVQRHPKGRCSSPAKWRALKIGEVQRAGPPPAADHGCYSQTATLSELTIAGRLRSSEWIFLGYFAYVALLAMVYPLPPETVARACLVLAGAAAVFVLLARPALKIVRDWIPLLFVLTAYREMDWFSIGYKARHLEAQWLRWDQWLFQAGFRAAIESLGPVVPWILEFSYLLVYGIGAFSIGALYGFHRRYRVNQFLIVYVSGTLLAYAMFPYFPSDPPRVVFPGSDLPQFLTGMRIVNLYLVGGYGIHSSVFPSAHVSSAFSAAWGLLRFLPERLWVGRAMLIYAVVVSVATIYGRYHYAADAVAGVVVSLAALAIAVRLRPVAASSSAAADRPVGAI